MSNDKPGKYITPTGKILTENQARWWERVFFGKLERRHKLLFDISDDGKYALLHITRISSYEELGDNKPARWMVCTFKKPAGFGKPEIVWEINCGLTPRPAMLMRFAEYGLKLIL
jgi:hypothetical protein